MNGEMSVETAAAKWAIIGLYVFPYVARAKVPFADSHGHLDASDDPEEVVRLFRHYTGTTGQDAGIGVHTGPSGLILFDADSVAADDAIRRRAGKAAIDTAVVADTSRGCHYWYRAPEGIPLGPITGLCGIPNLDIRAGSSFGILPPSPRPNGGVYRFRDHETAEAIARFPDLLAPCPEALIEMLREHAARNPAAGLRDDSGRTRIPEGQRNAVLWRAAAEARRHGADEEAITALVQTMNARQCPEPVDGGEERGIVRSVMKNVGTHAFAVIPEEMLLTAEELKEVAPGAEPPLKLHRLDVAYMIENDPPPVDWIVEGIAARSAVTMLHGDAGLGKSMFALAAAVAVTRGAPFMNHPTRVGRVLYIDAENGQGEAHRRIRALGLTASEAERLVYCEALDVDLRVDEDEIRRVALAAEPDLIVADSLATLSRSDEDSSGETTPAIQVLQRVARETQAAVILLHHDKKDRTNFRGSSAIAAVVEIRWHLTKDADRENARRLTNEKCRLAAEAPERWIEIRQSEGGVEVVQIAKPPTTKEAEAWDAVVDLLSDGVSRTNREIAAETGLASEKGACPGSLSRLLREKREAGHLIGGNAGGVTLAPHLLLPDRKAEAPPVPPPIANDPPDPLIPPQGDGSEDQIAAGAFMPDPDIGEAA